MVHGAGQCPILNAIGMGHGFATGVLGDQYDNIAQKYVLVYKDMGEGNDRGSL